MRSRALRSLVLVSTLVPGVAEATTIEVSWTGTVGLVAAELASYLAVGDPASGSFQIDTSIADTNADPGSGSYPGAATHISFHFGSYVLSANAGHLSIMDSIGDGFSVVVQYLGGAVEGVPVEYMNSYLESGPGGLSGDAIPLDLDFSEFHGGALIGGDFLGSPILVAATASSLAYVVPEPGTTMLFGLGLLLLASRRRRR